MRVTTGGASASGLFGRTVGTLFFLVFGLAGTFFGWQLLADLARLTATHQWPEQRCEILESRVQTQPSGDERFEPFVRYQYFIHGLPQISTKLSTKSFRSSDVGTVQRQLAAFPAGAKVPCYVNPRDAADAILVHEGYSKAFFLLLPLLFIVIGFGGAYGCIRGGRSSESLPTGTTPISKRAQPSSGSNIPVACFFGVFLLFGLFFGALMLPQVWRAYESTSWPKLTARVVSSDVSSDSSGDNGTTYAVDVLYEYQVNGKSYQSNLYRAFKSSSSSYSKQRALADRYKPGDSIECFVDPSDPTYAVLEAGAGWGALILLLPGLFIAVGLGGAVFALRGSSSSAPTQPVVHYVAPGPVELKASSSPSSRFFVLLFVSLFWNGIVSVFLWHVVQDMMSGVVVSFLSLFLLPFVLIGLGLLWGTAHAFLGLFLPKPRLTISSHSVALGSTASVTWEIAGNTDRIKSLTLTLTGHEEVRYTRGTSTYTDKREFYRDDFLKLTTLHGQRQGSATFTVPRDVMHSFEASNNKIVWTILLVGQIPLSPNLKEEYAIEVAPLSRRDR